MSMGQICRGSSLGDQIYSLACNSKFRVYVDVGTWNGKGSTLCLMEGLKGRPEATVYSVEANGQMFNEAVKNWTPCPDNLKLIWGKLSGVMMHEPAIKAHPLFYKVKEHYDLHYRQDCIDFSRAPIIDLPPTIDVAILDGGEWSSEGDLERVLNHKPTIIVLDDTAVMKNYDNRNKLLSLGWRIQCENSQDRNGWSILSAPSRGNYKVITEDDKYFESLDQFYDRLEAEGIFKRELQ